MVAEQIYSLRCMCVARVTSRDNKLFVFKLHGFCHRARSSLRRSKFIQLRLAKHDLNFKFGTLRRRDSEDLNKSATQLQALLLFEFLSTFRPRINLIKHAARRRTRTGDQAWPSRPPAAPIGTALRAGPSYRTDRMGRCQWTAHWHLREPARGPRPLVL